MGKKISGGKALLAFFTCGFSIPFVGIHKGKSARRKVSNKKSTSPSILQISALKSRCNIIGGLRGLDTDLVESSDIAACCERCAKYRRRIYSLTGRDRRFPKLPHDFNSYCCGLALYPYIWGVSEPAFTCRSVIQYSNRPFIDDRTVKQKEDYQKLLDLRETEKQKKHDKEVYHQLVSILPDDAPKSFSAFRRMKNSNSSSYIALKRKAQSVGLDF